MPLSNRRSITAVAGRLIAVLFAISCVQSALAQEPQQPTLESQPVPEPGQQERTRAGNKESAPEHDHTLELLSAIKGVEAAIRENIPEVDQDERKRQEEREITDLNAQQEMALWAKGMFGAAIASIGLTFIGLYLLWRTLRYTKEAAIAARETVVEARKATEAAEITNRIVARNSALELRAYLSVLPAGINELIGSQRAMGHVAIRNVGKVPARNVWVNVRMRVIDSRDDLKGGPPADVFWVPDDPKQKDPSFGVDRAIQPGTEMRQGCAEEDCVPVDDLLAMGRGYVYVWGVAYYDDGSKRRSTHFRHRYPIASHNRRADWDWPANETREVISIDKARFHPYGNSAN